MTLHIDGLTKRQRAFADIMWSMDSEDDVAAFVRSLPVDQSREAATVMYLMVWAMLDQITDTHVSSAYLTKFTL